MATMELPQRTRTITWMDPLIGAQAAPTMRGLDYLQAVARGDVPPPPILSLLGIEIGEVREGQVIFLVEPAEYHYNPIGTVHGGVTATLCDTAMAMTIYALLPAGVNCTTLELKVNFVRAVTEATGRVSCIGSVIHLGGRIATAEARVVDRDGSVYAHATTCNVQKSHPLASK